MDSFPKWLEALDDRHRRALSFQEVRRSVQALSSLYVERRNRLGEGAALDGAGKRAAFATYFAPLHFLLVREIVRALGAASRGVPAILDLGCGTGAGGAAWASEMKPPPRVTGIDRNPWAASEARWSYTAFGLEGSGKVLDVNTFKIPSGTAVLAAFILNELGEESRERWRTSLLSASERGSPVLVIEPIAKRLSPWWDDWSRDFVSAGGRNDEWRFPLVLPERLALMDKAAGLDHRELTGRSLWLAGRSNSAQRNV
jgi:SAM-dependent methyltransferase